MSALMLKLVYGINSIYYKSIKVEKRPIIYSTLIKRTI